MHRLTARMVAQMKAPGLYADGGGLYLQVTSSKEGAPRRSWLFRFTSPDGRRREMGLGSASLIDLAAAREQALAARKRVADGVDPIQALQAARAGAVAERARIMTFRQCAEAYMAAHAPSWITAITAVPWAGTAVPCPYTKRTAHLRRVARSSPGLVAGQPWQIPR